MSDTVPNLGNKGKAPADPVARLEAMVQQQAEQIAALQALVQRPAAETPDTLFAREIEQTKQRLASLEKVKQWVEMTCEQRTQHEADHRCKGPHRFRVCIPKPKDKPDPGQLTLEINAHSRAEAEGFYRELCGIIATDCPIVATQIAA